MSKIKVLNRCYLKFKSLYLNFNLIYLLKISFYDIPLLSIKIFAGLRSLWIMFMECKYSIANTISATINLAIVSSNLPYVLIIASKSPPKLKNL